VQRIAVCLWQFPRCFGLLQAACAIPRPGLKQSEPGLFCLVLATDGAVARTAVVASRCFLPDS
jgi:hypothetical protein